MSQADQRLPRLGVVVVTYNAADVITDCLQTLFASVGVILSVVVVDNASPDDSADVAAAARPSALVTRRSSPSIPISAWRASRGAISRKTSAKGA